MLRGGRHSLGAELAATYAEEAGRAPSSSALADALLVLEGRAQREPATVLALRVARHSDAVVIDLGTESGEVVSIGPGRGWQLLTRSPVLFRRTELTGALPTPTTSGSLADLRAFLNVTDVTWPLLMGWLVAALMPEIPHPVLLFTGEQGTGKTTAGRLVVGVVDPSPAALRCCPKDAEEWAVSAAGSWVVGIDNVSTIPPWLSDALCRAVTGDGLVRRRLYSDAELTVLAIRRAVVLTSIDPGGLRGDLADRLVPVELQRIVPERRREDAVLLADFADALPGIFGGLLELTAKVLDALPRVHEQTLPRMADFAKVLAALDAVLGTDALETYRALDGRLAAELVEADPVASALTQFAELRSGAPWEGTAAELLALLNPEPKPRGWPTDGTRLSGRIRRAAPALRSVGVIVEQNRSGRRRLIRVAQADGDAVVTLEPSMVTLEEAAASPRKPWSGSVGDAG